MSIDKVYSFFYLKCHFRAFKALEYIHLKLYKIERNVYYVSDGLSNLNTDLNTF